MYECSTFVLLGAVAGVHPLAAAESGPAFVQVSGGCGVQPQDIEDRVSQDMQDSQLTSPARQPG
jgi:hypothetical protein